MVVLNRATVIERLKSGEILRESGNTLEFKDGKSCSAATRIYLRDNKLIKATGKLSRRKYHWANLVIKSHRIFGVKWYDLAEPNKIPMQAVRVVINMPYEIAEMYRATIGGIGIIIEDYNIQNKESK